MAFASWTSRSQRRVVRRGDAALRPVALIEHQPQLVRTAVEDEPIALDGDRAEGGVAAHRVDQFAVARPRAPARASISVGFSGLHSSSLR